LSEGVHSGKFLMAGKKRPANATSNYIISTDSEKMEKAHLLTGQGEVEFSWHRIFDFDTGANPRKVKVDDEVRS